MWQYLCIYTFLTCKAECFVFSIPHMMIKTEEENADHGCSQRRSPITCGMFKVTLCSVLLLLFWDSIWCRSGLPSFSLKRNLALNSWFFCLHLPKAWITYRHVPGHPADVIFLQPRQWLFKSWMQKEKKKKAKKIVNLLTGSWVGLF